MAPTKMKFDPLNFGAIGGQVAQAMHDWQREDMFIHLDQIKESIKKKNDILERLDGMLHIKSNNQREYDVFESHHDFVQSRWVYRAREHQSPIINQFEFKGMHFSHKTISDIIRHVEYSGKYTKSDIQEVREKIDIFLLDKVVKNGWIMHPETAPKLPIKFKETIVIECVLLQNGCPYFEGCIAQGYSNADCRDNCDEYSPISTMTKKPIEGLEIIL